ncbi:MAG: TrmH family RNA methyltransferase [Cypionkella sp.]
MSFWTYMLRCADGTYYVGHTDDIERRWAEHHAGHFPACFTFKRRPLELAWSSDFPTRIEALEAERKLKGWSRAKKEALIRGDWAAVQRLAARRQSFETSPQPEASVSPSFETSPQPEASASPQDERSGDTSEIPVRAEEGLSASEGPSRSTPPPVCVLVRPQLGENIGTAARAMLNFGLAEMRLVAPRDGWPNPAAGPAAAGAARVLEQAQVFDSVAAAVADCAHVYATTVRKRGVTKPVVTPEEAAAAIHTGPGRSAILFGPERSGLETDDVALARAILTVPINPEFGSLNLAQAVILVAYEWSKGEALASPTVEDLLPPAPQAELDGLIDQLEAMLAPKGFFRPESRAAATRRTLRGVLTKPGWNHLEVRTLRGVLSYLAKPDRA